MTDKTYYKIVFCLVMSFVAVIGGYAYYGKATCDGDYDYLMGCKIEIIEEVPRTLLAKL